MSVSPERQAPGLLGRAPETPAPPANLDGQIKRLIAQVQRLGHTVTLQEANAA